MADGTQIAMTYEPHEDRILVRYPAQGREVRLWMTRRMASRWLGATAKILDHVQGMGAAPVDQRRAVSQFRRESAVAQADFTRPYNPTGNGPDAEKAAPDTDTVVDGDGNGKETGQGSGLPPFPPDGPLLVGRMTINAKKNGIMEVILSEGGDNTRKVTLAVSEREMHGLTHMLIMTANRAQWGLADPSLPDPKAPKVPQRVN
ncbi:hypothetical protein KAJ83_10110 [Marivibrio halodurans]|uniref:Uncharacterized protein n=1 Tax=Marivibrio halodurans TaxID=2039722 RepID=A0A8J7S8K3_9PROT|nr:hypothetical protein [Marivibrio halodurans]MBP5857362.1 hypothetical protein [Marivibrio halodurans]